jgi:hypothetical protein
LCRADPGLLVVCSGSSGLFAGVVKVFSAPTPLVEEDEGSCTGWRSAYAMLMSYVLEDRRVLREAKKLNDQVMIMKRRGSQYDGVQLKRMDFSHRSTRSACTRRMIGSSSAPMGPTAATIGTPAS